MLEERDSRRGRRVRRRRPRAVSEADYPSYEGEESRDESSDRPAGERSGRRRRPEARSSGENRGSRRSEDSSARPRRRSRRPGNDSDRRRGSGSSNGRGSDSSRRRRRPDSRAPRSEGIHDATASRMAAAENQMPRRGGNTNRRRGGGSGGRSGGGDRSKGLEILKLLQQEISIDPFQRYHLETTPDQVSMRVMDLIAPIGRGQRALIVSPPKAGKTTLLIQVAEALHANHPEVQVFALLVDERPEEVTHFKRSTHATVYAASSDMSARDHITIAEDCMNTIVPPVLEGGDVVLLLDSITRLARAYNTVQGNSGRTLSGGLDATTMLAPRQIFGAARKVEGGGSLTILGTALVDTGSRMDEVIFQEFKGTGNTELVLSRDLFEKRIFPSVDIGKSGTRKEEKLYPEDQVGRLHKLRRLAASYPADQAMLGVLKLMQRHKTNEELLASLAGLD